MTSIQNLRTFVAGRVPTTTQLIDGAIAINHVDGKLYFRHDQTVNGSTVSKASAVWTQDTLTDVSQLGNSVGYVSSTGSARLTALDFQATTAIPITGQGAYLQWNRSSGDGGTWLINQKGVGGGGITFGEVTSSNAFTQTFAIDPSGNITAPGSATLGGHVTHSELYHVSHFGVKADGITDDTAAFQAAVSSGKHLRLADGTMVISGQITFNTQGQVIRGSSPWQTVVYVVSIPQGSAGIFNVAAVGVELHDFCIDHNQPTTGTSFTQYPPSVLINNTIRVRMNHVRIRRGTSGVYMAGNCEGATLTDLELACFGQNLYGDGCTDSVRIYNPHIWPWDLSGAQFDYFLTSPNCTGMTFGRMDDIQVYGGLIITGGAQLYTFNGTSTNAGAAFGKFVGVGFDTTPNVNLTGNGWLLFSSCYFTCGVWNFGQAYPAQYAIVQSGGGAMFSSCYFLIATAVSGSYAINMSSTTGAQTSFVGCEFQTGVAQSLMGVGGTNHLVNISGGFVQASTAVPNYIINLASGSGSICGLCFIGAGSVAIAANTNVSYAISGVDFGNQSLELLSPSNVTVSGCVGVGSVLPFGLNTAKLVVSSTPPASSSAAGTTGTITWDANYTYVCVATNVWRRVAMSAF